MSSIGVLQVSMGRVGMTHHGWDLGGHRDRVGHRDVGWHTGDAGVGGLVHHGLLNMQAVQLGGGLSQLDVLDGLDIAEKGNATRGHALLSGKRKIGGASEGLEHTGAGHWSRSVLDGQDGTRWALEDSGQVVLSMDRLMDWEATGMSWRSLGWTTRGGTTGGWTTGGRTTLGSCAPGLGLGSRRWGWEGWCWG